MSSSPSRRVTHPFSSQSKACFSYHPSLWVPSPQYGEDSSRIFYASIASWTSTWITYCPQPSTPDDLSWRISAYIFTAESSQLLIFFAASIWIILLSYLQFLEGISTWTASSISHSTQLYCSQPLHYKVECDRSESPRTLIMVCQFNKYLSLSPLLYAGLHPSSLRSSFYPSYRPSLFNQQQIYIFSHKFFLHFKSCRCADVPIINLLNLYSYSSFGASISISMFVEIPNVPLTNKNISVDLFP